MDRSRRHSVRRASGSVGRLQEGHEGKGRIKGDPGFGALTTR